MPAYCKKFWLACAAALCALCLNGCVSAPQVIAIKPTLPPEGSYHRVEKGQTLWRISKLYGVELERLVLANKISDASAIEVGQMILIPKRTPAPRTAPVTVIGEDFMWPLQGKVISSFGQTHNNMLNKGINIAPFKEAQVQASRSGKVVFYSPDFEVFGNTVIIDHGDGFSTVYAGNSEVLVRIGDMVPRGVAIAKVTPYSKGSANYLHFEIRKGHQCENPYYYLPR